MFQCLTDWDKYSMFLKLKLLYFRTYLFQIFNRKGIFPFPYYMELAEMVGKYDCKNILEIGTGLGLTTSAMLGMNKNIKVTTLEKDFFILSKAKANIKNIVGEEVFKNVTFVNERYFDWLEKIQKDKHIKESFDLIFLDAYISRYNEVWQIAELLKIGGVFVVSNIREDIEKSVKAREYLLDQNKYEHLQTLGDTIFVRKK